MQGSKGEIVKMVFHTHKMGLITSALVYVLLFYADYAMVYQVIEYGQNKRLV